MRITTRILLGCVLVGILLPVTACVVALYYFHALADLAQSPDTTLAAQYANQAGQIVIMLTTIAAIMSVTLGLFMGRSIALPITRLTTQLRDLRAGHTTSATPPPPVNDELRGLWQAVQDLARAGLPSVG